MAEAGSERMEGGQEREYAEHLLVTDPLVAPLNRAAISALGLPDGSRGLDAGCGVGLQALLLAEAVGETGSVVGMDFLAGLLAETRLRAAAAHLSGRIEVVVGDVRRLPFADDEFDWAWSANCVGYGIPDPVAAVAELTRVVRPGGLVALLVWSSQMLLPGYPRLEARLNGTTPGLAPFSEGTPPEQHHLRGLGLLAAAGLCDSGVSTFAGQVCAPLTPPLRAALVALLAMRWPAAEDELSAADGEVFLRLCRPDSPDFILDRSDYYALFTETLFWGTVG